LAILLGFCEDLQHHPVANYYSWNDKNQEIGKTQLGHQKFWKEPATEVFWTAGYGKDKEIPQVKNGQGTQRNIWF
jgi:hypothetical protein